MKNKNENMGERQANAAACLESLVTGNPHFVYEVEGYFVVVDEFGTAASSLLVACFKDGRLVRPLEALAASAPPAAQLKLAEVLGITVDPWRKN